MEFESSLSPGHVIKNSPNKRQVALKNLLHVLFLEGGFIKSYFPSEGFEVPRS